MKQFLLPYGLLLSIFLLLFHEFHRLPDGNLRLQLLDVGQGDAILIETPGNQRILVDGGPDATVLERVGEELPFFSKRIDLLVLTHTDSDHVAGLPDVLARYDVDRILMTGTEYDSSIYRAFLAAADAEGAEIIFADAAHDLDLGFGAFLDVLWPMQNLFGQGVDDPNNASIVARLRWKDHSILLTGDIETEVEQELLKAGYDLKSEILKVAHHGSRTSSSTGFLLAVQPELALISVGKDNDFGHPHSDVLARYEQMNIDVLRTDEQRVDIILH